MLIQTRLDDDDALSFKAFFELRKAVCDSVRNKKTMGSVSFKGGYDWLLEKDKLVINSADNLAIGLSVFLLGPQSIGIFDYVHDSLHDKFSTSKNTESIILNDNRKWWIYVKHGLSDSNYFGMRYRFLNQECIGIPDDFLCDFGVSSDDVNYLNDFIAESPVGFPAQVIRLGVKYDNLAQTDSLLKRKVMSNVLRYRVLNEMPITDYRGCVASSVFIELLGEGFFSYNDVKESFKKYDVFLVDDSFVIDLISKKDSFALLDVLVQHELCDYFFLIDTQRATVCSDSVQAEYQKFKNKLDKMQEVGGFRLEDLGEVDFLKRVVRQIRLNLF